jgi:signal transduction histidine kinase
MKISDDVMEIENKEVQLIQLQKMAIVGTLACGLAHDFNNILCGIIRTVSIMKQKLSEVPASERDNFRNYLDLIDNAGQRAINTVEQLMSVSRKEKLSTVRFDLNESVKNVLLLCRNTFNKSVCITEKYSELPAFVIGDASLIEQVILNICINASHAMTIMRYNTDSWGGELFVSVKDYMPDQMFLYSHPEAEKRIYRTVSIKDSGVGMGQEILDKIFIPFFSTKEDGAGTGLGLSMVCSIVRQHKGFVDVFSEPGKGSEFMLYIPALRM